MIYRLKVTIEGIRPAVWRRVEVSGEETLGHLHEVIQRVFGWQDCHLHLFRVGEERYGIPEPGSREPGSPEKDERGVRLEEVVGQAGEEFVYWYDFGDDWMHRVKVEAVGKAAEGVAYPRCTGGKRNGPPEDSGGPAEYMEMLKALRNRKHPAHAVMAEWIGDHDGEAFEVVEVDRRLGALRRGRGAGVTRAR